MTLGTAPCIHPANSPASAASLHLAGTSTAVCLSCSGMRMIICLASASASSSWVFVPFAIASIAPFMPPSFVPLPLFASYDSVFFFQSSETYSGSSGSISIVTGSTIARSASLLVPAVKVADRSAVHLVPRSPAPSVRRLRSARMALRSSSNPTSSMRSASSSTSHRSRSALNAVVLRRWSNSLPGVATNTLTPFRSLAFSFCLFSPPITPPHTTQW
mmetsp:Transcript_5006/g.22584  ORF Transcript_5006/g.22584 Transcript_5006/m.22584 type:complete len:217 (+) Transcript_5006:503-1153(+)